MTDKTLPTGYDLHVAADLPGFLADQAILHQEPEPIGYWESFDRNGYRYGRVVRKDSAEEWMRKLPDGKWTKIITLTKPTDRQQKGPQPTRPRPAWAGNIAQQRRSRK